MNNNSNKQVILALIENAWQLRRSQLHNDAEKLLAKALMISEQQALDPLTINIWIKQAHLAMDKHLSDKALSLINKALELSRLKKLSWEEAHSLKHLGDAYRQNGALDQAKQSYLDSLAIYRQSISANSVHTANCLRALALLYQDSGENKLATEHWSQASTLYQRFGVTEGVKECDEKINQLKRKKHSP